MTTIEEKGGSVICVPSIFRPRASNILINNQMMKFEDLFDFCYMEISKK